MCFATAAAVVGVIGAAVSAYGTIAGGEAAARRANYAAQIARNNEQRQKMMADRELQAGQRRAEMKSLEGASRVAKVKAAQAARGVDITSDSAVDVQASERALANLDTETTMNDAMLRAYGFRSRAADESAQAGLYDAAAADSRTASYIGAAGTLLSKASSLPLAFGGGGGTSSFTGTPQGAAEYGSPAYPGSSTFGGPR